MVVGIGTDIIEIDRIKKAVLQANFVKKVYTVAEEEYCRSRGAQAVASFAARFAAKEAVAKAFGTGFVGGFFADIEILPDERGCPKVKLYNGFAKTATEKNISNIHVSLSHAHDFATAVCVLEVIQ